MIAIIIFISAVMIAIPLWGIWIECRQGHETMAATLDELIRKG